MFIIKGAIVNKVAERFESPKPKLFRKSRKEKKGSNKEI